MQNINSTPMKNRVNAALVIMLGIMLSSVSCTNTNRAERTPIQYTDYNQQTDLHGNTEAEVSACVNRVMKCIANGDARQFASLVVYPLSRTYPLKDIENEKQMIAYFDTMFDDSIRNIMRHATKDNWFNGGWRGYGFDNGLIWVSPNSSSKPVTSVNYMSAKERALLEKTIKEDVASLHRSLQKKGLRPIMCLQDSVNGSILRIDRMGKDGAPYRLVLYGKDKNLSGAPDVCVNGTLEIQGSMGVRNYTFKDRQTTYEFDSYSYLLHISVAGEEKEQHELVTCYWSDLIK